MPRVKIINTPHITSGGSGSKITYTINSDEIVSAILEASERGLARLAVDSVDEAQKTGSYENRTGNLRRMITPNYKHASDNPSNYSGTDVTFTDSEGVSRTRKQFTPPSTFDNPDIIRTAENLKVVVAAIMEYAAAVEAKGRTVLTHVFHQIIANPQKVSQIFKAEFDKASSRQVGLAGKNLTLKK